jgi:DNA-binding protein WhiA
MNLITKIKDELNSREISNSGARNVFGGISRRSDRRTDRRSDGRGGRFTDEGFIFPYEKIKTDTDKMKPKELKEFISGVFLSCGGGRIMMGENRKNFGYVIEFSFEDTGNARIFCEMLSQFGIFPKLVLIKNLAVIRIQSADCICNFLALTGAKNCLMEFNNETALRELRNTANRRANCDTGNIEKQVNASSRQIKIIETLIANGGIKKLSPKLQETAIARIQHPDATYEQLAELLSVTKSGVVNRLHNITK